MTTYWNIDDAHGTELAAGMDEVTARRAAASLAARLGESVYLYEVGGDVSPEDDAEEVTP